MSQPASPKFPLTGGCMCGAIRYEVSAPLVSAAYCHCTRCQRRSGAAAAPSAHVARGSLRWTSGQENIRTWWPPDGWGKAFCAHCGSQLFAQAPGDPEAIALRLGTFDSDPGIRPSLRNHVETAAAWEPIPDDGLPRVTGAP